MNKLSKDNKNIKRLQDDLVVIGSGAGIVAAVSAAEKGADVIVLEKQGVLGGKTRMAFGFFACESPLQERKNILTDKDEYFKIAMKWAHWNRIDPRIVRAFINKSGDTIRWLEEKGVEFDGNAIKPGKLHSAHVPKGSRCSVLMDKLIKEGQRLGVKFLTQTACEKILRSKDGTVAGVVAEKNEKSLEIRADSVVIATGGFPGNTGLLERYCPDYHRGMYVGNWPYHTGDGLLMVSEIGGCIAEDIPIFHVGPNPESGGPNGKLAPMARNPFTIWVNKRGKRFIDEAGYMIWENGNGILMQPDGVMYTLFDEETRAFVEDHSRSSGNDGPEEMMSMGVPGLGEKLRKEAGNGGARISESLDGIAEWIGADLEVLKNEIKDYNTCCDTGYDKVFAKAPEYLRPLRNPPFYAIKCITDCGETMGGIKANERMEVVDEKGRPIPGLYVAGVIADGWSSQTYCCDEMSGSAAGFAINSGRIAGENAAEYIRMRP